MGNYWLDEIEKGETHCVMADVQMQTTDLLQEFINTAAHLGRKGMPFPPEFFALLTGLAQELYEL